MASGRRAGLAVAAGVTTGSFTWSVLAAFGLGAIMLANAWMFEIVRYFGAAYLGWLAIRSARSAWMGAALKVPPVTRRSIKGHYAKGLALHLTNPKAVLFFGALYSVGVPPGTPITGLITVILAVGTLSFTVFHGYAVIFSSALMTRAYSRAKRGFEAVFAVFFGVAALRILTGRLV